MTKEEFVRLYSIQFCASIMAVNYQDICSRGWNDNNRKPPVEDAIHLAEHAWDEFQNYGRKYF